MGKFASWLRPARLGLAAASAGLLLAGCSSKSEMVENTSAEIELSADNAEQDVANAARLREGPPKPGNDAGEAAANAAAPAYCGRTRTIETPADCARFEEIWRKADIGSGAVSAPDQVARGETAHIVFALSGAPNEAAPEQALGARPSEKVEGIRVSRFMAAQLGGAGFDIRPAGLQVKDLGLGPLQRWEWDATALKAPAHSLSLSVYMVVRDKGGDTNTLLRSTEIPLKVVVTRGQKIEDTIDGSQAWMARGTNWLKALAAFLAALLAVWLALRKFRKPDEGKA